MGNPGKLAPSSSLPVTQTRKKEMSSRVLHVFACFPDTPFFQAFLNQASFWKDNPVLLKRVPATLLYKNPPAIWNLRVD